MKKKRGEEGGGKGEGGQNREEQRVRTIFITLMGEILRHEILSECVFLTWVRPCQRPQCLSPMGVAKPPLGKPQGEGKACSGVQTLTVRAMQKIPLSLPPSRCSQSAPSRLTKPAPRSAVYQPLLLVYLYLITLPPCSAELSNPISLFSWIE